MILEWLDSHQLEAMAAIVADCRLQMGLAAELNWNVNTLGEAMVSGKVLGALVKPELLGFVLLIETGSEAVGWEAEIWCLATHPSHQGRGVMSALLAELQKKYVNVWLEVHERNYTALAFYKSKGFQQLGRRKRYYSDGGDALLFSWSSKKP